MPPYFSLQGRTALVTGGTRGIGLGIVQKFAENGANVAFTFVSSVEKAQKVEHRANVESLPVAGDDSEPLIVVALFSWIQSKLQKR